MSTSRYNDGLVSVIIPAYNSAKHISKSVNSVFAQTFENFEIIIVDDYSTDNTREVIKKLSEYDQRVRYVFLEKNSGAAVARNTGMANAKGRYIAFLDSDDVWEPNKLSIQMSYLKENNPFVFCAYDIIDGNGNTLDKKMKIKKVVKYEDLLTRTYISTPTVIFDRKIFGDVKMPLRRTGQDYAFWLILLKKCNAYGIDEVLVHVVRRPGSLSKNKFQNLIDVYETQTQNEGIKKSKAALNTFFYLIYAFKKRIMHK